MADRGLERVDARQVAVGDLVTGSGLDVGETYLPAMTQITVTMMTNIAAIVGDDMPTHDFEGTLLLSRARQKNEPVRICLSKMLANIILGVSTLAPRIEDVDSHLYMHLLKHTYGLTQATYQFNLYLDMKLEDMIFLPLHGDLSAYTRGKRSTWVDTCVYVDVILARGKAARANSEVELNCAVGISTRKGEKLSCLGMLVKSHTDRYVVIMKGYGNALCSRLSLDLDKVTKPQRRRVLASVFEASPKNGHNKDRLRYLAVIM